MPCAEPWRGQTARPTAALRLAQRGGIPLFPDPPPPLTGKLGTGDGNAAVLFNRRERHPMPRFEHADRRTSHRDHQHDVIQRRAGR